MKGKLKDVRALVFDVFGTVVDWRGSVIAEGRALARKKRLTVDWPAFADAWRAGYAPAMDRVRRGEPIDGLVPPSVADIVRRRGLYREVAA